MPSEHVYTARRRYAARNTRATLTYRSDVPFKLCNSFKWLTNPFPVSISPWYNEQNWQTRRGREKGKTSMASLLVLMLYLAQATDPNQDVLGLIIFGFDFIIFTLIAMA